MNERRSVAAGAASVVAVLTVVGAALLIAFLAREDRFQALSEDVRSVDAVVVGLSIALIGSAVYAAASRFVHRAAKRYDADHSSCSLPRR